LPESPLVSIVVTTRNEEHNLFSCLESIKLQTYKNIELIVIDNNSTDRTKKIALRYTDKVYNKGPERSAQRNYGMISISSGLYVMFIDADMILSPTLIESCVDCISSGKFIALHIPEVILGKGYFSKVRRFERSFYNGTVVDGARFFLKSIFIDVGGFDEDLSGPEDWDIDKKIKALGVIGLLEKEDSVIRQWSMQGLIQQYGVDPYCYGSAIYHNESEFDLRRYLSKKAYYSESFDTYINKWGKNDPDIKKQFGMSYRLFGVFTENGKYIKLLKHPHLTIGMYSLRILIGINYLKRSLSN